MRLRFREVAALAITLAAVQGASARAQWGYPVGYGAYGWSFPPASNPRGSHGMNSAVFMLSATYAVVASMVKSGI